MAKHLGPVPAGCLALEAQTLGIPRLFAQHGLWEDNPDPRVPFDCDVYLVFGELSRRALIYGGVAPERVHTVGNPSLDGSSADSQAARLTDRARELAGGKRVILLAAQPGDVIRPPEVAGGWGEAVFRAARKIGNCRVIVKMHPRETDPTVYEMAAQQEGADVVVVRPGEAELAELVAACHVFMTGYSTAAFEAMAQGKPVVTVNITGKPDPIHIAAGGGAVAVREAAEILPLLRRLLEEGPPPELLASQRAYLDLQMSPRDGKASQRILEVLRPYLKARGPDACGSAPVHFPLDS